MRARTRNSGPESEASYHPADLAFLTLPPKALWRGGIQRPMYCTYYPPPGSKRHHEISNATPKPRLYPQHRKSQVLWRVSIRYRPLIWPVQAWCYQSRDGALNRGGDSSRHSSGIGKKEK